MRRSFLHRTAVAFAVVLLLSPLQASARDTVVVQWNETMLQAIRDARFAPMWSARALGIVHTAMYDAWAAYDHRALPTEPGAPSRRPLSERTETNKREAISYAAYAALKDLFVGPPVSPAVQATILAALDARMAALGYNPATLGTTAASVGELAARAVLAMHHDDGANQAFGYADYTGYVPVNTASRINDPNRWQPLATPTGVQQFLAPHWGLVSCFALATAGELRPPAPPQFPERQYKKEADEVLRFSATLGDREKMIAAYWADGPSTETPPGHWNLFAQFVSRRDHHSLDDDVKMFFALGNALLDASVAVWEAKVYYDFARPVTAIRYLYAGQTISAWGGPGQGTVQMPGDNWRSYIATPPFAEYVSGHSTFSAASAEVLKSFTGSDKFGASVTFAAGSSSIEPGLVPAAPLTLSWRTFSDAADEAGISRRYGGIHFESGDRAARKLGRKIGAKVWAAAEDYFYDRRRF